MIQIDYYDCIKDKGRIVKTKRRSQAIGVRPPLKWAGGKYLLLPRIRPLLAGHGKRLVEPFAGSCVLSLNTEFDQYWINDTNPDLINFYKNLKRMGPHFISRAKRYFAERYNTPERYYRLRDHFNFTVDSEKRAILFLYLNRHAFNGLCRYNNFGCFNTPFGSYKKAYFPEQELKNFINHSRRMKFTCLDFTKVMQQASNDDVVYCDPPYVPLSKTAKFTKYAGQTFLSNQHELLADLAKDTSQRGILTVVANHNTKFTRDLYCHADQVKKFKVPRFISCNGADRKEVSELMAIFLPKA